MTADSQPRDAYTPAGNWLFFIIVALAYGSVFVSAPTLPTSFKEITLLALGILYVVIGTAGMAWCERAGRRWTVPAYFVVQIILSAVIIFLTLDQSGLMAIIAYPLAAHGVVLLPTRWMIAVCVAIVAVLVVPVGVVAGWANGFEAALGFSAGMIFVVLFTQIAVKEERARNKVERLADELGRANQNCANTRCRLKNWQPLRNATGWPAKFTTAWGII